MTAEAFMKRTMVRTTVGIICFLALAGMATTATAHSCSLASVAGEYGYTSNGTIVSPPVGPFAAVGHVAFTASGTFSGAQTTSIAGNFFDETVSGTYSVNRDCTGTAVVNVYHGATLARTTNLNLVWDDNQKEIRAIFLTPGTAITINAKKVLREEQEE
jgi:ABC-type transporter lipoprotein component MlaA